MIEGKSNIRGALFFGLAGAGVIRIGWVYLKGRSLIDGVGITLVTLALAAFISWIRSG